MTIRRNPPMARARRLVLAACALLASSAGPAQPPRADATAVAALRARGKAMLRAAEPALFPREDVKFRSYDTIAATALHGCGPPALAEGMVGLLDPAKYKASVDPAGLAFLLPPLVRYLRLYPQCLSPDQFRRIRLWLEQPLPIFTHGTLNHALMTATSLYLLAEMLPDQAWREGRGQPVASATMVSRYRQLLLERLANGLTHGHSEQLSPTYAPVHLVALVNLRDFAADPALRAAAEVALVAQIAMLRADARDAFILPPYAREPNRGGQTADWPRTNASDVLWYYYGTGDRPPHQPAGPMFMAMLTTSHWVPPAALLALGGEAGSYEIATRTPEFSEWARDGAPQLYGSALIAPGYAIGAGNVATAATIARPTQAVAFAIRPRGAEGVIECIAMPDDRASPRQQVWRYGSEGALVYLPGAAPSCRYGLTPDEIVTAPDGLWLRYGTTAVALRFAGGTARYGEGKGPADGGPVGLVSLSGERPAIAFSVATLAAGQGLAAYRQSLAARPIAYDAASGTLRFRATDGRLVAVRAVPPVAVAGGRMASFPSVMLDHAPVPPPAATGDVFRSPMLRIGQGRFDLRSPAGALSGSIAGDRATFAVRSPLTAQAAPAAGSR
ncbi:hypothetical protein PQ455_18780 [Sphingomonas naphthae]|uniref:Heparinase n=1 Tax=Sphingomonas naphthae TaxID=1813468 RepID=A0ABY7TKY4_9SPHN|nr:hypothetical protein [Sphingomonas naphthae]WCT73626.1 hypothetical protein PQ455_18780 [Sphingomonas naphthae]